MFLAGAPAADGAAGRAGRPALRLGDGAAARVVEADLVVVHAPVRPADGTAELARLLRIGTSPRGFLLDRAASPFEPTATRIAGVYVAGAAAGPRTIAQAIRDGTAAAGSSCPRWSSASARRSSPSPPRWTRRSAAGAACASPRAPSGR